MVALMDYRDNRYDKSNIDMVDYRGNRDDKSDISYECINTLHLIDLLELMNLIYIL